MTGCLLDDPMFLVEGKERKEKVNKVFSDVEQLQKESKLSDRYMYIVQLTICRNLWGSTISRSSIHSVLASAKFYELIATCHVYVLIWS